MGKASRSKHVALKPETVAAIELAAGLIRNPAVLGTFLTHRMRADAPDLQGIANTLSSAAAAVGDTSAQQALGQLPANLAHMVEALDLPPAEWAKRLRPAFANRAFADLLAQCVRHARQCFIGVDPVTALLFEGNTRPPDDDPRAQAVVRAHRRMVDDPADPRWLALALFCVARMIAVNAHSAFNSNEWSELTLFWFTIEKNFLAGDGALIASNLVQLNRDYFDGQLAELIGARMLHGLGEAAINAPDAPFFA